MEAVLLCGLPGSGKTTLYRDRYAATHAHISLDELGGRSREAAVLEECLGAGRPFVVDNTNPTVADRARYIEPARAAGYAVVGYVVEAGTSADRPGHVVGVTARRFVRPTPEEGFDVLWHATAAPGGGWRIEPLLSTPPLF